MVRFVFALLVISHAAYAQPAPGVLDRGIFVTTVTAEIEASKDTFGDPVSVAPDLAVGVTDDLTLLALHSTFGRTGFRGNAGGGLCLTDACKQIYDNAGVEGALNVLRGPLAVAANLGVHAVSIDAEHYAAKVGARLRVLASGVSITSLPSVAIAVTERDAESRNHDRIFVPINISTQVAPGLTLGLITGFKSQIEDIGTHYELAAGAFASYAATDSVSFAASWVQGKIAGGDDALPAGASGVDSRAIQLWVTITRSAYPRYR